jgi:hypothetical protein
MLQRRERVVSVSITSRLHLVAATRGKVKSVRRRSVLRSVSRCRRQQAQKSSAPSSTARVCTDRGLQTLKILRWYASNRSFVELAPMLLM